MGKKRISRIVKTGLLTLTVALFMTDSIYATSLSDNDAKEVDSVAEMSQFQCTGEIIPLEEAIGDILYEEANLTEAEAYNKIMNLQTQYPDGMSLTDANFTYKFNVPIDGVRYTGTGCAGFAFAVSDAVFGTAPVTKYTTFEKIRVGDILRINNDSHSVVVLRISGDTVTIVEGNNGGKVKWNRTLSLSSLRSGVAQYGLTRYSDTAPSTPSGLCGNTLSYNIQNGVLSIRGNGAMNNFTGSKKAPWYDFRNTITRIDIEDGVTTIGNNAFYNMPNLKSVNIPNSVQSLGNSAFYGCKSLKEIKLPNKITVLPDMLLADCTSLEYVEVPSGLTTINGKPFNGCNKLEGIYLPNTVTSIADFYQAFAQTVVFCEDNAPVMALKGASSGVDALLCPRSEWSGAIGNGATYSFNLNDRSLVINGSGKRTNISSIFKGYKYVRSVRFTNFSGKEMPIIMSYFESLESFAIPEGVTTLYNSEFVQARSLKSLYIPATVTTIASYAIGGTPEGFCIQGISGSAAEDYANKKGIPFVAVNGAPSQPVNPADEAAIKAFVSRMYTVALGREAETAGLNSWSNRLLTHDIDGAGIAFGFICSAEFTNRRLGNSDFVDTLYRTFFDREPDAGGKANWMNTLNRGTGRTEVLAGFVNSKEFANLCDRFNIARGTMQANGSTIYNAGVRNYVLRMYTKALNRAGETVGVEDWANRINTGIATPESVAKSFFASPEFINRRLSNDAYVETLYQTFMDRPSDAGGKAYWVARLNAGVSRSTVLEGFSRSPEFAKIIKSFGL